MTHTTGRAGVAPSLVAEGTACSQCGGGDAFYSMRVKAPLCEACRTAWRHGRTASPTDADLLDTSEVEQAVRRLSAGVQGLVARSLAAHHHAGHTH